MKKITKKGKKKQFMCYCICMIIFGSLLIPYTLKASTSISTNKAEFGKYPTKKEIKNKIGYEPKLTKTLLNNYIFKEASITEVTEENKDMIKGLNVKYQKAKSKDSQYLSLFITRENEKITEKKYITYKKIKIYYNKEYHCVVWRDSKITYILYDYGNDLTKKELESMAKEIIKSKN